MTDWTEWKYEPKSPEELKDIVVGIAEGRIFTNEHIKAEDKEVLSDVFLSIGMMGSPAFRDAMRREEIDMFYASRDAAGPWTVNEYPVFLSCGFLNKDEVAYVRQALQTLFKETEEQLAQRRAENNEEECEE